MPLPKEYLRLATERAKSRYRDYAQAEDFGYSFEDWVSPYTNGAHAQGEFLFLLQDWASEDGLRGDYNPEIARLGRNPQLRTNQRFEVLLREHFRREIHEVYVTNAFPYVKHGGMGAHLPINHVLECARQFALKEIEVARPNVVFALGRIPSAVLRALSVPHVTLPHPAARIGNITAHREAWRIALANRGYD